MSDQTGGHRRGRWRGARGAAGRAVRRVRWRSVAVVGALAVVGSAAGAALAPDTETVVGPLRLDVRVSPSIDPGVDVGLPPAGAVHFATHWAPVRVTADVAAVDVDEAKELVSSSGGLVDLQVRAPDLMREAVLQAAAGTVGCALLGALALGALGTRSVRRTAACGATSLGLVLALGVGTAATFEPDRLAQPTFTGLLSRAPYITARTSSLAARLESYRSGMADFVQSVTTLYAVGEQLPTFQEDRGNVITVLHVSDLHLNPLGYDLVEQLVGQFGVEAVLDAGDTTTWGTTAESAFLDRIGRLGRRGVPYVFVRGNHDSTTTAQAVARQPGAVVLDDDVREVAGLVIAGVGDPRFTPEEGEDEERGKDQLEAAVSDLADTVETYDASHPDSPVNIVLVHDPSRLDPVLGKVPLVLAGHTHKRTVRVEDGTRVMVQGTTGGAGITARGLARLGEGAPLPLQATVLYLVRSGPRAGRLLAYDQVAVGGLGLTSVSVERTVVREGDDEAAPEAAVTPGRGPTSPAPGPSTTP